MSKFTPSGRVTTDGKIVRLDGNEICVAKDAETAVMIGTVIESAGVAFFDIPPEHRAELYRMFR